MRKDTKLFKVLKAIYFAKGKISTREISEKTGIELKNIVPYTNRINRFLNREKINGMWNYSMSKQNRDYVRKYIENAV